VKFFARNHYQIVGTSEWTDLRREAGYLTTELLEWVTYGKIMTKPAADFNEEEEKEEEDEVN